MMAPDSSDKLGRWRRMRLLAAALVCSCIVSLAAASGAGAYLYWGNGTSIGRANTDGTGVNVNFIQGLSTKPAGVAVYGGRVYWANKDSGSIGRANLDGTEVKQNFISGLQFPTAAVAVDSGHIYWLYAYSGSGPYPNNIGRANLDGSGVDPWWWFMGYPPTGLTSDNTYLYWPNQHGWIGRLPVDGSSPPNSNFISGGGLTYVEKGIAVSGGHLYWTNYDGRSIGRAKLDGTEVDNFFITGLTSVAGLAVSNAHIYWTQYWAGAIGRANLDGTGVDQNFIALPYVTRYLALDLQPSATRVDCLPGGVQVRGSTSCTATVTDQTANPFTPSGTVAFTTYRGSLSADSCTLTPGSTFAPASGLSASCSVLWYPPDTAVPGDYHSVNASYSGDDVHATSSGDRGFVIVAPGAVPELTDVTQTATSWTAAGALLETAAAKRPVGTTFGLTLNRPARVRFLFTRTTTGRLAGGRCVAQTERNRRSQRCLRTVRAAFSRQARTGRIRVRFQGRVSRNRTLAPGRYRLIMIATANGLRSEPAILRFAILP